MQYPKVAIVYLSYRSEPYIDDAMSAISKLIYPKEQIDLIIVDNFHPKFGSSKKYIEEKVLTRTDLPPVIFLPQDKNLGFCGGNNAGLNAAVDAKCKYAYLHNQDGEMDPGCLIKLVEALENDEKIGCAQSLVLLHPEKDKINTAGNSFHYLGFGFIDHFGAPKSAALAGQIKNIGYATGSSLIMRTELLKKFGLLDEDLFAYHEDVEYSLRLKFAGYKVVCVNDAIFFHKYEFNRSPSKFYFMERNRWAVLLMYYSWATLILLLPMLFIMELGMLFFFWKNGWWKEKMDVYGYWMEPNNRRLWLGKRKLIQSMRKISDEKLLRGAVDKVIFGEKEDMNNPLLIYIANPLMILYGWVVRTIVFW